MRHSIMGERKEIDKERAEIGVSGLSSGACRAQKVMLGHGPPAMCVRRGVPRYLGITVLANCAE